MSDGSPLSNNQVREVDARAELAVRRYFDHYLDKVIPRKEEEARQHVELLIQQHDDDDEAHGSVEKRLNKAIWMCVGASMAGSGGAVGVLKLLGGLGA